MTVSGTTNRIQYTGTGAVATFSTGTIIFYADTDLIVTETVIATGVDTVLSLTTDYTVIGGNGAAGSITLVAGNLPSTKRITIERAIPYTQTIDLVEGEAVLASTLETGFDKATIQIQQLKDAIDRSLKVASTSTASPITFPSFSSNKLLKWSSSSTIGNTSFTDSDIQGAITAVAALSAQSGVTISSNDTTVGFLNGKLVAGDNISLTENNNGGNETLTLACTLAVPDQIPVGVMVDYAGTTAPSKWLLCSGEAISRTTYSALFAAIGTTYGAGDGSTTFNLPDRRGRGSAGKDDMGGTSANRLTALPGGVDGDVLGATGGAESHTLTVAQTPALEARADALFFFAGAGAQSIVRSLTPNASGTHFLTTNGGGGAHNNVQPTIVVNVIIYTGVP